MTKKRRKLLQNAASGKVYDEATWQAIIQELLDDFAEFVGQKVETDQEVQLNASAPSFNIWFWSTFPIQVSPLSTIWSAVMAGGLAVDDDGNEKFTVSATLFLFDAQLKCRLQTKDGRSIIEFTYDVHTPRKGYWKCLGWFKDEYDEWTDVDFE